MDQRIEQQPPRKTIAREYPGEREGKRQRREHRDPADLERQRNNPPLLGRQHQGAVKPWRVKIVRACRDNRNARNAAASPLRDVLSSASG